MSNDMMVNLINNALLLLVLSVIYEITYYIPVSFRRFKQVLTGFLVSLVCLVIMSVPFTLQPGLFFDTRSILISVTALSFGPVPALLTAVVAILYRISIGGTGFLPGIAVISSSLIIGLAWRRWLWTGDPSVKMERFYLALSTPR